MIADLPRHLGRRHRRRQALQLERANGSEIVAAATPGEDPHDVADEDLRALGGVAQPAGFDDRRPEAVVALPHDVAGAEPDADRHRSGRAACQPLDPALHRLCRRNCFDGGVEHDHQAVAGALDLVTAVGSDCITQHAVVRPAQLIGGVVADGLAQRGGADEIGKEDSGRRRPTRLPCPRCHGAHATGAPSPIRSRPMAGGFDPFDPGQAQRAWPLLKELRRQGPVAPIAGGMHYVTRHAECREVLRDTEAFSNASGMKAQGVEVPLEDRILGELDPPQHSVVRRVMVTALTPKVVHAAEPFIRGTAEGLLDVVTVPGRADLVPAYSVPLPNRVTVHLLGFPAEDADTIAGWAGGLMVSEFPRTNRTERGEGFAGAFPEFAGYIDEKVDHRLRDVERGKDVPDDVLTRLVQLEVDGERLNRNQLRALTRNLITGGLTTTSQLLGNLLYELLTVPGLEQIVRRDAGALANAVEESLRIAPPLLFVARGCVHDTSVGDTPVAAGERVIVGTGSANRDELLFEEGDEFRVDRPNADQHLTFGYGPHVCPGAAMARIVARIGIAVFLERFPPGSVRLAADYEFENVPTFFEIGPRRLPVDTGVA